MATKQQSTIKQPIDHSYLPPAQLFIGQHEHLVKNVQHYLQKVVCPNNGCLTCVTCRHIQEKQHHAIVWLYPEKQYTLAQLAIIFKTISFSLNPGQHFFFIIQKADFLTPTCANSLLKVIEEPPSGYHFILLAEREECILPTIQSRCVKQMLYSDEDNTQHHNLLSFFISTKPNDPSAFLQALNQSNINERESLELLDTLLKHWMQQLKQSFTDNNFAKNAQQKQHESAERIIHTLKKAMLKPPMPGSSKIFWKNLFLQINNDN